MRGKLDVFIIAGVLIWLVTTVTDRFIKKISAKPALALYAIGLLCLVVGMFRGRA